MKEPVIFCDIFKQGTKITLFTSPYICCALIMNQSEPVYFDYNATTPLDEQVLEAMLPFFRNHFGNAASNTHRHGWFAKGAVDKAREQVALAIGAEPDEIVFTSGSTESMNTALKGIYEAYSGKGKHIITSKTEHKAVLDTCEYLESKGARITYLDVDPEGRIDLTLLGQAITAETIAVCIMAANNETGVIQDIEAIGEIAHAHKTIFVSDTTQYIGKLRFDVNESNVDVCCISAHKLYGPKGVGAMYLRRKSPRVSIIPLLHGGGHENGRRSGTLNVPGIVGLGKAMEVAQADMWDVNTHVSKLKNQFEHYLLDIEGLRINGSTRHRLYNTSNICFPHIKQGGTLLQALPSFSFSAGSACTSAAASPSHVLKAMGLSDEDVKQSFRFSFGKYNTAEEISRVIESLKLVYNA
ncbi:MAG: cysteine desulfurase [Bacteroidetes bacterium]|nr:cysteine desulfurase [Bacteroidota bacterium]